VEVRAIGFESVRVAVALLVGGGADNRVHLVMARHVASLDTVRVVEMATDQALLRSGFEQRRRFGGGKFVDRAAIARRNPMFTTDLLQGMAGVDVRPIGIGRIVLMRNFMGELCIPTLYIDGARYQPQDIKELDALMDPYRIGGMEVYPRAAQAPLQFAGTMKDGCGVIVIWSRSVDVQRR
jgi:hypothetical protein